MINYIEKGNGLHESLIAAGVSLEDKNGTWVSNNEALAQSIIDSYDPLPYERTQTKSRIIKEASKRVAEIYPFINPEKEEAIGLYEFAIDLYQATIAAAREPLSGRLLQFKVIHDKAQAAIAVINASNDWEFILAYDAVNDPGW